jgi:hypothetical protein
MAGSGEQWIPICQWLRHSREMTQVYSRKVTTKPPEADEVRLGQDRDGGTALGTAEQEINILHACGVDDIVLAHFLARGQIPFLGVGQFSERN